ncbi:hypothetical protein [Halorussus litoreus]|uniref:hypothetical protein n=1 Tax=Halorussus litoreus TaxID=1710536 RepID=UPI000E25F5FF|nr:hypothetical protein [Halorussus litoreus]
MTGDTSELEARLAALGRDVATLREDLSTVVNRDVPVLKGTIRQISGIDIDTVGDLPDAGRAFNLQFEEQSERLDKVEQRLAQLGTIGQEPTSKEEKFAAILAFAQNKRNGESKVSVTPNEVRGCAGVSRRYAYDLIEAMATEIKGVSVRDPTRVQTGNGTKRKQKALLVDCEQVRTESGSVNQFTTRTSR